MRYFTAYYRQSDADSSVSVLLQQVYHKKRKMPVILACISTDEEQKCGSQVLHMLSDWFYGTGLSRCSRLGERGMNMISDSLMCGLYDIMHAGTAIGACRWAGALCVGQSVLLFEKGEKQLSLLNTRKHRSYCQTLELPERAGLSVQSGTIQRGAGILLATQGFNSCLSVQKRQECLPVGEIRSQELSERRLKELGLYGESLNGKNLGAILIVAR